MLGHALARSSKIETKAKSKKDNHVTSPRIMRTHQADVVELSIKNRSMRDLIAEDLNLYHKKI
ncbi:hypothetical protein MTR67_001995 [Solanum verrucosum]|uniref:Uncharacterized protein n=1 Tax=Solanum verrucosum TaxID=315347 RepID=A0AAF0PSV6_SOLVR|nr:hypothetical protein MTR67_001995 [Solanum verrucosum]